MAKTPWEMAAVGDESSHQKALFAWAAMARMFGPHIANEEASYKVAGHAKKTFETWRGSFPHYEPIPQLVWLHAIKNAEKGGAIRGAMAVAEGVRSGVFDVFLPVVTRFEYGENLTNARRFKGPGLEFSHGQWGFAGLYVELKTPDRKNHKNGGMSDEQLAFQAWALDQGYAAELAHGWEELRDTILRYLGRA